MNSDDEMIGTDYSTSQVFKLLFRFSLEAERSRQPAAPTDSDRTSWIE
jgi:hypothetical protein